MAIADYLNKLVELKNDLITTLRNKGVEVSDDEKLNTLVMKVNEVKGEQNVEWVDEPNFTGSSEETGLVKAISKIKIPDSVTSIGMCAFYKCYNLTSIIIPDTITSFDNAVFFECIRLAHIYYKGTQTQWDAITKGFNWSYKMGELVTGGTVIHYNYIPE